MKIHEILLSKLDHDKQKKQVTFSIEFFPPKTEQGIINLKKRIQKFAELEPIFFDITWGAGGSTSDQTLELSKHIHTSGHTCNMHLTCTNMTLEKIDHALKTAHDFGLTNILALRGDPISVSDNQKKQQDLIIDEQLTSALDLVRYIRSKYDDHFGITVAGYPEGHPSQITMIPRDELKNLSEKEKIRLSFRDENYYCCRDEAYQNELRYLKSKVDAGADMIITQLFFDSQLFIQFQQDCYEIGIRVPIIPGIMLIQNYNSFRRMITLCQTKVPKILMDRFDSTDRENVDLIQEIGLEHIKQMIHDLKGHVDHFHLYVLNKEKIAFQVIEHLKYF